MGIREDPSAEAATVIPHGRHGDGTHEDHGDVANKERVSPWGGQKTNDDLPIRHTSKDSFDTRLDEYRARIDHRLRKARVWHARVDEAFDRYYQKWILEGLLRQRPLPPSKDGRHIPLTAGDVRISPLIDERSGKHY